MNDLRTRRRDRRELADRLIVEYAGAVPPGQVLAAVVRADRAVRAAGSFPRGRWLPLCETIARRTLAERSARLPAALAAVTG